MTTIEVHAKPDGTTGAPPAPMHAEHARAELMELRIALRENLVSFHEVARSWFGAHDGGLPAEVREEYRELFKDLLDRFETTRGGIESDYFCEHIRVAVALTDIEHAAASTNDVRRELDLPRHWWQRRRHALASAIFIEPLLGEPSCWDSKELLGRALDLHYRALEFLRPEHRKVCLRRVFATITSLLGTLDNRAGTPGQDPKLLPDEVSRLRRDLDEAELYFRKHAEQRAQLYYVMGMVCGLLLLLAILSVIALSADVPLKDPMLVALFAGGIGAVMSVMMRMARSTLTLEREIGQGTAIMLGGMRPFVGAVFGGLMYVLITGNLISVKPGGKDPTFVTYAGLAFLAGFSERVANSVIDTGGNALTGATPSGGRELGAPTSQP